MGLPHGRDTQLLPLRLSALPLPIPRLLCIFDKSWNCLNVARIKMLSKQLILKLEHERIHFSKQKKKNNETIDFSNLEKRNCHLKINY